MAFSRRGTLPVLDLDGERFVDSTRIIAALEQLEIVAKIPADPSYGDLRFNPCRDSLRGDPRFEKIITKLSPTP